MSISELWNRFLTAAFILYSELRNQNGDKLDPTPLLAEVLK